MRGKVLQSGLTSRARRITPAYAGKSWNEQAAKCAERDHPRLCGEKPPASGVHAVKIGSPPPMRGKGVGRIRAGRGLRITPAYAGKRSQRKCWTKSCGGSPPPMRGKAFAYLLLPCVSWITPAYAGKRRRSGRNRLLGRDHPRLCGEKRKFKFPKKGGTGSPPPMRGKELFPVVSVRRGRITPAYAGKSWEFRAV